MNDSLFDPESFMSQEVKGANDTKFPTIPQGEYASIANKIECKQQPNSKDPSVIYTILDVHWTIDDQGVREATKLEKPMVRQSIFLDLTDEGKLDMTVTKNVGLGKLRAALGLNDPAKPFTFAQIVGNAAVVTVNHRPNVEDPENPFAGVKKVAKM